MSKKGLKYGEVVQCKEPNWQPLLNLAPVFVDGFMWMHEIELKGGLRVHAFKHYWTRRYVHLGVDGTAYVFVDSGQYKKVEAGPLLVEALHDSLGHLCLE